MSLRNLHLVRAELNRLVAWVMTDAGVRVAVCPGDRVTFQYHGQNRLGVLVGVGRGGFRMLEDSGHLKSFRVDGITGLEFLPR